MLQSKLFSKTRKTPPADEVSKNAELLFRAGFIEKVQAGVYAFLPLGFRVLKKIENAIREEMNKVGGEELLLPALHPKELWEKTGRWNTMTDLYKLKDSSGKENALGPTHEEVIVPLAKNFISSYRHLPVYLYQIQTKFRMELRPKSGLLRGREFIMKDLYSFHRDEADLDRYYGLMVEAYGAIFGRLGLGDITFLTYASGGSFSKYSHEFQTLTESGEDTIHLCEKCKLAVNEEIIVEQKTCPKCGSEKLSSKKSVEVGNIFKLKTKYSEPFGLTYKDEDGEDKLITMGCYGIGLGRVMGTIAEVLSDERGLIWPEEIAPFKVHIIPVGDNSGEVGETSKALYDSLTEGGIEVLYDDRDDKGAGEKFADSDLMGIPYRIIISEKSISAGGVEIKKRNEADSEIVSPGDVLKRIK